MGNESSAFPAWKHNAPSAAAKQTSVPRWRQGGNVAASAPLLPKRQLALGLVWLSFLSFCAALVWVATWVSPPREVAVFLVGAGYEDNPVFPPNCAGQAFLRELAQEIKKPASRNGQLLHLVEDRIHEVRTEAAWDAGLENFSDSTLLLVVSMHGATDELGPFLLPTNADAKPDVPLNRLRMQTILKRLERVPANVKILLVLDVTQMPSHWPLGMLHNDFARGMAGLEDRIKKMPNLVVMTSSGMDQLSLTSHDWGKTIFGHYLIEGLRGGADLDGNHKIDALELHRFIGDKVSHWAHSDRSAEQRPLLLPKEGGEARAQSIVLNLASRGYAPMDPETLPQALFGPEVHAAWQIWKEMRSATPPPYVHSPHAWQQYETTLMQYEYAMRFADAGTAKRKKDRLRSLERTIAEAGPVRLRSAEATLAMPAATGAKEKKIDPAVDLFLRKFWETKDEAAKEVWEEAKKDLWKGQPIPVDELSGWILERVAQEKAAGLARAAKRLQIVRPADRPLPAEAHWVVMMNRDLPAQTRGEPVIADLIGLALEVRLLAEQSAVAAAKGTYACSEQVQPWIAFALAQADQQRQFGQDLLLSSQKSDWQQARGLLTQAKKSYQAVQQQAGVVRTALLTRDQALSALPAYSHWQALRPAYSMVKPPVDDPQLETTIKDVWVDLHGLMKLLETRPNVDLLKADAKQADGASALQEQTRRVSKGFAFLEKRFDRYLSSLQNARIIANVDMRYVWLETEAALTVPQADVARRKQLLTRQHKLSNRLLLEGYIYATPPLPEDAVAAIKRKARREGEMALALLGTEWFDRFAGAKEENHQQVQRRLEVATVEETWFHTIFEAGKRIGKSTRRMPLQVERLLTPHPKAEQSPQEALQAADLLARRMEATSPMPAGFDPVGEYRKLQLGNFMLAQTQRTYQDHWYDDDPSAEPYYSAAGRSFLGDAKGLISAGRRELWSAGLKQAIDGWNKKLRNPNELIVRDATEASNDGPPGKVAIVTSEQQWNRDYRIMPAHPKDEVPSGFPTLWIEDTANLRVTEPAALERVAVSLTLDVQKQEQAIFRCRLTSPLVMQAEDKVGPLPGRERSPLKVRGLYRGQVLRLETPVDVYAEPTMIVRQFPLPEKASVAVRTDRDLTIRVGTNNSGVAFVLDCSGSMRPPTNGDYREGRYYRAVEALKVVLQKLPKGTTVSVLTFGQAVGAERTTEQPESSIDHALLPTIWNPQDAGQLDGLIGSLNGREPWNQSPLARAMLAAREDLKTIKGNKTVVVITDGHDNRFEREKEMVAKYGDIPGFLKKTFDKSEVSLHMVLFPPLTGEEKKAQELYRGIASYEPAGKIHPIDDIGKLATLLEAVMRQRLNYFVDRTGQNVSVNGIPESGLDVSTSDQNDRWYGKGLLPGGQKVRVNVPERIEKDVLLNRGDLLLLDLVQTPLGRTFERYLFSDDYSWKRREENPAKNWRMTVMQNQLLEKNALQMLMTLEKTVDRRETILEQIKPRDVWIEVHLPPEETREISTRWSFLAGYPAPAWSIDVPNWPNYAGTTTAMRPLLKVWWNPDEEFRSGAELQALPLLKERNRPVVMQNEKNVLLESATLEKHRVEVRRGTFETRECLVIRMSHELKHPIMTRFAGAEVAGAEHRFYDKAGKYAALYWFDDEKQALAATQARLRIISVNAFKAEAERRGYALQVRDLNGPEPTDFRPRPPLELK